MPSGIVNPLSFFLGGDQEFSINWEDDQVW